MATSDHENVTITHKMRFDRQKLKQIVILSCATRPLPREMRNWGKIAILSGRAAGSPAWYQILIVENWWKCVIMLRRVKAFDVNAPVCCKSICV